MLTVTSKVISTFMFKCNDHGGEYKILNGEEEEEGERERGWKRMDEKEED